MYIKKCGAFLIPFSCFFINMSFSMSAFILNLFEDFSSWRRICKLVSEATIARSEPHSLQYLRVIEINHYIYGWKSLHPLSKEKRKKASIIRLVHVNSESNVWSFRSVSYIFTEFLSLEIKQVLPSAVFTSSKWLGYVSTSLLMRSICSKVTWTASLCWAPHGA